MQTTNQVISTLKANQFQTCNDRSIPSKQSENKFKRNYAERKLIMLDLWEALTVELGSAFSKQFGSPRESTFEHWLQELWDFSREDLFRGLERFKRAGKTYISLNVFRSHCSVNRAELGLPDLNQAYRLVIARAWEELHPAFQHIAQERIEVEEKYLHDRKFKVGKLKHDLASLRGMKEFEALKAFRPYYDEVIERATSGEAFERIQSVEHRPDIPRSDAQKKMSRKQGREALQSLLSEMRGRA